MCKLIQTNSGRLQGRAGTKRHYRLTWPQAQVLFQMICKGKRLGWQWMYTRRKMYAGNGWADCTYKTLEVLARNGHIQRQTGDEAGNATYAHTVAGYGALDEYVRKHMK